MRFVPKDSSDKKFSIYTYLILWVGMVFTIAALLAGHLLVAVFLFVLFIFFLLKKMRMSTDFEGFDKELSRDSPIFWFEQKSELEKIQKDK